MKTKTFALKVVICGIVMSVGFSFFPYVFAKEVIPPFHNIFIVTQQGEDSITLDQHALSFSPQPLFPPQDPSFPKRPWIVLSHEEKIWLLRKLEEELSDLETFGEILQELEEEELNENLETVKDTLQREVDRWIITQEQANNVIHQLKSTSLRESYELSLLEEEKQQHEREVIDDIQQEIALAVKNGLLNGIQADEILTNLETGVWDIHKGGVLFDLRSC